MNSSRRIKTVLGALAACIAASLLVAPAGALAISRNEVLARAQAVVNSPVPYSQSKYVGSWRNDCSGYVSWVWNTGSNLYVTANLDSISFPIPKEQLQPGDVLLKAGTHVRLFYAWADDAHTKYVSYEQTPPRTWSSIQDISADIEAGYKPYRYNKITDSPPPWNALRNGPFDVWDKGSKINDGRPEAWAPAWWYSGSTGLGTSTQIRTDQVGSPVFALGLANSASTPSTYIEARHYGVVEPGKTYTYVAYAGATSQPGAVVMCLQFYNAVGTLLADKRTTGDAWGIGASGLKPMSLTAVVPPGTTRADAILGLAGAVSPPGGSGGTAVFDDVTLYVTSPLPVYRFFSPSTGAHFYTASGPERDVVANTLSSTFTYEGPAYGVVANGANSTPLQRFYNKKNGTHFYTASAEECENVKSTLSATYSYDGPVYNVCATPIAGALPVYRFYNKQNGTHFYTSSDAERDNTVSKLSAIYTLEGPAFYLAQ
ncbi:MAG: hypothetical protein WCJ13_08345 [Coriobacteriia bacterium]